MLKKSRFQILALLLVISAVASPEETTQESKTAQKKDAGPTLRIVKDDLYQRGNFYFVKGSIYNPNEKGVENVVIRYYIWKKFIGHADRGSLVSKGGGLEEATIKYLPPKQTVEFTTDDSAPVYIDVKPDPIKAELAAEWEH